jgi:hypothetical protein
VVACVVTKGEHDRLRGSAHGWHRYGSAGIEVYDMAVDPPALLDLDAPQAPDFSPKS